jgi:hypothetical protein
MCSQWRKLTATWADDYVDINLTLGYFVYLQTSNLLHGLDGFRCQRLCWISHRYHDMQALQFNICDVPLRASQEEYPHPGKPSSPPAATQYMASSGARSNVSGQELEFITTTGPPSERSQTSRDIVRSHVRRSFLLEKKGEGRAGPELDAEMDERHIGELKGRFRLAAWSRRKTRKRRKNIIPSEDTSQMPVESPPYGVWDPEKLGCTVCHP